MKHYTFAVTLTTTLSAIGLNRADAEAKVRYLFDHHTANLGILDDQPVVVDLCIEGELDLEDEE